MRSRGSPSTVSGGGADTFERFTQRARQVVVLAQDEARSLGHAFIASDHLLLGLIREAEGLAARVLDSLGVSYEAARADALARHGEGEQVTAGQIPFTPAAKKALELALREALSIGHNYLGTEHLLLGLSRADDGVFASYGLGGEQVHEAVLAAFASEPKSPWERATDIYEADEFRPELLEVFRSQGWEIVRVLVERRRRRADA